MNLLVELAFERLGAFRNHSLDGFGVVTLVDGYEADRVARRGADEIGLENHCAFLALVEHLDLDFGRSGRSGEGECSAERQRGNDLVHCFSFLKHGCRNRWPVYMPRHADAVCVRANSG